ncbi:MAG TPA: sn-glycerol-1-phosphate dehydrogenase [Clostridiaceae bacterium]|nr:sn-glycerol-1-phosphate dehydrogenase [Clostridiaceae bacterium]
MSFNIVYKENKLILPEFDCDCGMNHNTPEMDIYIGSGIIENCAEYIKKSIAGKNALVVADNNTWEVAGSKVVKILSDAGFHMVNCILKREGKLEPDQTALGEIMLAVEPDTEFIVAVGSGVINDLSRYAAYCIGKPLVSIGTAPSMDGYTSVISSLHNKNLVMTKHDKYARVLVCDVDIMRNAPYDMMISGFGDVLGKFISKADWTLGKIVNNEVCCPVCLEILTLALNKCINNIDGIRNRTREGVQSLIEALILTGLTILICGQTRPVASIEHNMAHFWDMMKLQDGEESPAHGTSVGVGTVYAARFFDLFFKIDTSSLNKSEIRKRKKTKEQWEKEVLECYGEVLGPSILKNNPDEYIDWDEQERRIDTVISNMDRIKKELSFLPTGSRMIEIMNQIGAPVKAGQLDIDRKLLKDALMYGKDYRSRYTVFKTANELGLLEEFVDKLLEEDE